MLVYVGVYAGCMLVCSHGGQTALGAASEDAFHFGFGDRDSHESGVH